MKRSAEKDQIEIDAFNCVVSSWGPLGTWLLMRLDKLARGGARGMAAGFV